MTDKYSALHLVTKHDFSTPLTLKQSENLNRINKFRDVIPTALQEGRICISEPYDVLTCNNGGFRSTEKLLVILFNLPSFSDCKDKL